MTETKTATAFCELALPVKDLVIGIKGAGEMATGLACRLFNANIRHLFMMETDHPLAVRRTVSFCEALYDGTITVEGVTARKAPDKYRIPFVWQDGEIPVLIDPKWSAIAAVQPHVVIDAIIAKKNLGTRLSEAPLTIGLGPGFHAGDDVDLVIETNRGHDMGRVIRQGAAAPDTGIPGSIMGISKDRVLRAPCSGTFTSDLVIGTLVRQNDIVGHVNEVPVVSKISGMLRGMLRSGAHVRQGLKLGDIDPRGKEASFTTISEKARAIGGAVLEAIMSQYNK